jgi:hypothetical protein
VIFSKLLVTLVVGFEETNVFNSLGFYVSTFQRESIFAKLHSDINSLKPGLSHLTSQSNSQKGRARG